jgi:chromosome segregation ATPase
VPNLKPGRKEIMPDNNDNLPVTRAELKEILAEFADRIINYVETRFKGIDRRFDELQGQMTGVQSQMAELQGQMTGVQSQIAELQGQMAELRSRLEKVEAALVELRKQQEKVEVELGTLRAQNVLLEDRLKHVEAGLERMVLALFKFENRDDIRTEQIANLIEDLKKLNGRFSLVQSEVTEFKSKYSMERVLVEMEEFRQMALRLEKRVTVLEKNQAASAAA